MVSLFFLKKYLQHLYSLQGFDYYDKYDVFYDIGILQV